MDNLMAMAMVMDTDMDMGILKMNRKRNGGNFGNWLQTLLYCTLDEFV